MQKPKLKIGFWFALIIGTESLIFTVVTYYSLHFLWLVCGLLLGLTLCLLGLFIDFFIQFKHYYETTKDIMVRHTALSKEFDNKNRVLDEYESAFVSIGHAILFAMANLSKNEKAQFENLFRVVSLHKQNISEVKKSEESI